MNITLRKTPAIDLITASDRTVLSYCPDLLCSGDTISLAVANGAYHLNGGYTYRLLINVSNDSFVYPEAVFYAQGVPTDPEELKNHIDSEYLDEAIQLLNYIKLHQMIRE